MIGDAGRRRQLLRRAIGLDLQDGLEIGEPCRRIIGRRRRNDLGDVQCIRRKERRAAKGGEAERNNEDEERRKTRAR